MARDVDPIMAELRVLRYAAGRRAEDVAAVAGVRDASVSSWENGRVSPILRNLRAYAAALGYDLALVPLEKP